MSEPIDSPTSPTPGDCAPRRAEPLISVCILAGHGLEALDGVSAKPRRTG